MYDGTALKEDTTGSKESVLIRVVSFFQRVKYVVFINLGSYRALQIFIREVS